MSLPDADLDTTTVEVSLRLLKMIEYQWTRVPPTCPCCHEKPADGHRPFCILGLTIASATTDVKIQPK